MISRLSLCNVGPFKELDLEFDNLTRIVGENGAGKSIIFDSLDIVLNSKPFPEDYVFKGESYASITVTMYSGLVLSRIRDNGVQYLSVSDSDGERKYSNPLQMKDEVTRLSRFGMSKIDATTEMSCQFIPIDADQFFMVSGVSPATVMRRISNLVSGSDFSVAKKAIEGKLKEIEAVRKHIESMTKNDSSKFKDLPDLEHINSKFKDLSVREKELEGVENDLHFLNKALADIERDYSILDIDTNGLETIYTTCMSIICGIDATDANIGDLSYILESIERQDEEVDKKTKIADDLYETLQKTGAVCDKCGRPV